MSQVTVHVLLMLILSISGQQLLQNAGFEQPLTGDDWFCNSNCDLSQDTDAHTGLYSGRVTNRQESWQGVNQWVTLTANATYYFESWVKPLNIASGKMYQDGRLMVALQSETSIRYLTMGIQPYMRPDRGWQLLSGDFLYGPEEIVQARVYVQFNDIDVNYLVDTTSLTKITPNENWKSEAEARIEQHRKGDITLNVDLSGDFNLEEISIQINLQKHHFGFGSAVREDQLIGTDEDSQKYRECYFDNFQRAVFHNAHKWPQMEWRRGEVVFPDEAMAVLENNGMLPMRGHCLFWGVEDHLPNWVFDISPEELVDDMLRRINYTVTRYQGQICSGTNSTEGLLSGHPLALNLCTEADSNTRHRSVFHWDVNNEQLHGDFFEKITGDIDIMTKIFQEVHNQDDDALLFLNDYHIINNGNTARALANSAQLLQSQGAPVHGIGMQGHIVENATLDVITKMQKRLEVIGSVGLPLWVTEFDVSQVSDPTDKANSYDDLLTLFFSDPNMEGVILWGFSDLHHWRPDAALFEGPDYIPNESGLRWMEMMKSRWHSYASYSPTSYQESFTLRGFKGNYLVQVSQDGTVLHESFVYLENEDITADITVE